MKRLIKHLNCCNSFLALEQVVCIDGCKGTPLNAIGLTSRLFQPPSIRHQT